MDIRDARPEDADAVRTVATESMAASYAPGVDESAIRTAVDEWYSAERISDALENPDTVFLVVEDEDSLIAFSKGAVVERRSQTGEIHWLHVDPERRDEGVGRRLLAATENEFAKRGTARLAGYVLAVNEVGAQFYERNGYELEGEREVSVGDRSFEERRYGKFSKETDDDALEPVAGPDGDTLYVDFREARQGDSDAFYPVYRSADAERRYGWYCEDCESTDVVMDTMERVECNGCGNRSKPTRWDAAYL